jgi:hypothetical protein
MSRRPIMHAWIRGGGEGLGNRLGEGSLVVAWESRRGGKLSHVGVGVGGRVHLPRMVIFPSYSALQVGCP